MSLKRGTPFMLPPSLSPHGLSLSALPIYTPLISLPKRREKKKKQHSYQIKLHSLFTKMKNQTIFSLLLILALYVSTTTTRVNGQRGRMVGQRKEIKDVKTNKEVQDLGKFSVHQYNYNLQAMSPASAGRGGGGGGRGGANGRLVFLEVVEAEKQVVAGLKYYLKVKAMQDGLSKTFDAVVVVKPWVRSKELLDFGPARPSPS